MKKEDKNKKAADEQRVMNNNTAFGCTVKTVLQRERRMKPGKVYEGTFRRDVEHDDFQWDEHYTFTEGQRQMVVSRRYPLVYQGWYVNVHRHDDGALYPSFKRVPIKEDTDVEDFIKIVGLELRNGLKSSVGKSTR